MISEQIDKIKKTWGKLASFAAWIASIALAFLLPLPDWGNYESQESHMHFILFSSTATAGFMLILTFIIKNKKLWNLISLLLFLSLCFSFYSYSYKRDLNTLPYDGHRVVVGHELKSTSKEKLDALHMDEHDPELLLTVSGDPSKIWTVVSIDSNRWELILYLWLSYFFLTGFVISFTTSIILYGKKNNTD